MLQPNGTIAASAVVTGITEANTGCFSDIEYTDDNGSIVLTTPHVFKPRKRVFVALCDSKKLERAMGLFQMALSLEKWDGDMVLLTDEDITESDIDFFEARNIEVKPMPMLFSPELGKEWGNIVFHKYYLFSELFQQWDNLVFMDYDFVIHDDIRRLGYVDKLYAIHDYLTIRRQFENTDWFTPEVVPQYNLGKIAMNVGCFAFPTKFYGNNIQGFITKSAGDPEPL